jgi:hypothetical protein
LPFGDHPPEGAHARERGHGDGQSYDPPRPEPGSNPLVEFEFIPVLTSEGALAVVAPGL